MSLTPGRGGGKLCDKYMSHRSTYLLDIHSARPQREISLPPRARHLGVHITGYGNTVRVAEGNCCVQILVFGCNNTVIVEENVSTGCDCRIQLGDESCPVFNSTVHIGKNVRMVQANLFLLESGSGIHIGDDCLISNGVEIWCTDSHAMFSPDGDLRYGRAIHLGKSVWVGMRCLIGKNCEIADGCVVGWGSVVSGKFPVPNCLIAGAPATVRKEGIRWRYDRPDALRREKEELLAVYGDWDAPPPPSLWMKAGLYLKWAYYAAAAACSLHVGQRERRFARAAACRKRLGT